jgi:hypothetical protein
MVHFTQLTAALAAISLCGARKPTIEERQIPADATGVKTITSPQGATIRFKQPGKAGICETKEGVDDYAGYISLNPTTNMFFWFFEARENPSEKPLTLWLNGGPGSDSLIGLFQEHGPCNVTEDLKTQWNPYSWNEHSNMLYLSQPSPWPRTLQTLQRSALPVTHLFSSTALSMARYASMVTLASPGFTRQVTRCLTISLLPAWSISSVYLTMSLFRTEVSLSRTPLVLMVRQRLRIRKVSYHCQLRVRRAWPAV